MKFEKGVPMPSVGIKHRWDDVKRMEVGDSFFIADTTTTRMGSTLTNIKKKTGFRFAARTVAEDGVAGVRVWRVE